MFTGTPPPSIPEAINDANAESTFLSWFRAIAGVKGVAFGLLIGMGFYVRRAYNDYQTLRAANKALRQERDEFKETAAEYSELSAKTAQQSNTLYSIYLEMLARTREQARLNTTVKPADKEQPSPPEDANDFKEDLENAEQHVRNVDHFIQETTHGLRETSCGSNFTKKNR